VQEAAQLAVLAHQDIQAVALQVQAHISNKPFTFLQIKQLLLVLVALVASQKTLVLVAMFHQSVL
jgi:hypothetical protein